MTLLALFLFPFLESGTAPTPEPKDVKSPEAARADRPELISHQQSIKNVHNAAMAYRGQYGKGALKLDENCCRLAQRWANHMAANQAFHHGPNDQIIAYGTQTSTATVRMWMNSPPHATWILSNSRLCGWGFQRASNGTPYWVGVFR